jgi:hypothetical protein
MNARDDIPWYLRTWLLFPERVGESLRRVEEAGLVERVPNRWQVGLGVLRMWHRVLFRSDTIGTCAEDPVRPTWRARLFDNRALRFPFLLAERAIAPLDFSGLASPPERVIRHLLGAHHDGLQFAYDLALLSVHPGKLEELRQRARAVVEGSDPRAEWLRDLVVYDRYHERLLEAVEGALADGVRLPDDAEADPDISFTGYLRWCAAQPATPEETLAAWRRGEYTIADGLRRPEPPRPAPHPELRPAA